MKISHFNNITVEYKNTIISFILAEKGGYIMSKTLGEIINNIMEENSSRKVLILTNHMQILGTIHDYYENCKNCHECLIALKDVKIARIEDLCNCAIQDCECTFESFVEYKWFNISTNAIVGFSILGESH